VDLRRTLAHNIRAAAAKKRKSIVTLADLADVSAAHLYDVIRCEKAATIDFVEKVAGPLGIEPWRLLCRETEDSEPSKKRRKSRA
jgi:hypothetical protein